MAVLFFAQKWLVPAIPLCYGADIKTDRSLTVRKSYVVETDFDYSRVQSVTAGDRSRPDHFHRRADNQ